MALVYIAVLGIFGWLMISRRMTATLALPLAALSIAVIALSGVAVDSGILPACHQLLNDVVEAGITRLSGAIFAVLLGAVLAAQMQHTGAAERIVRYAAEYAGEDRFRLGLLLLVVMAVLFTTLGGLGAVILVASITLPLLLSLGFDPRIAGGLFLLGLSLGGCLNPVNWALYRDVLGLDVSQIVPYAVTLSAVFLLISILFLLAFTTSRHDWHRQALPVAGVVLLAIAVGVLIARVPVVWTYLKHSLAVFLLIILAILAVLLVVRTLLVAFLGKAKGDGWLATPGNWLAAGSILVPLLLLLWSTLHVSITGQGNARLGIGILAALSTGICFCALASWTRDGTSANRMMRSLFEGMTSAGPAVVLMLGIGLLLKAVTLPPVSSSIGEWLTYLPVGSPIGFVVTFFVLSPLALYRGPLNLWGMGSAVVGIISGNAMLAGSLIMVAFFSVGMLQGVCDPTNTHNVWIASFCKVPVNDLTRLTLPWIFAVVLLGLTAGAIIFSGSFTAPFA